MMLPAGNRPAASSVHYTTICNTESGAPEDGRNYRPKHVELVGIINKRLLLHLVCCLYYCISDARSYKHRLELISLAYCNALLRGIVPLQGFCFCRKM